MAVSDHGEETRDQMTSERAPSMIEFITTGSPTTVSRAIESHAAQERSITALVVPWQSNGASVVMSVTAAAGEGRAIDHANLGTITLIDLGDDRTRVKLEAAEQLQADHKPRASLFDQFVRTLQGRFQESS